MQSLLSFSPVSQLSSFINFLDGSSLLKHFSDDEGDDEGYDEEDDVEEEVKSKEEMEEVEEEEEDKEDDEVEDIGREEK